MNGAHERVSRRDNDLAICLPQTVVDALALKDGDHVEIRICGERAFEIRRDTPKERALEQIRALSRPLPPDWKFNRDDANAR